MKTTINKLFGTARDLTVDHLKELIKTKQINFESLEDIEDIRHYLEEVVEDIEVATDKFDSKTGERIYKQATFPGSQKDLLNAIYKNFSEWYLNDYEDRFKVEIPKYNKRETIKAVKDLKAAAWMIDKEDIARFLLDLAHVANHLVGRENFQKQIWLTSSIMGGGKTTFINKLLKSYSECGVKTKETKFPDNKYPNVLDFANNQICYINDIVYGQDLNKSAYMAIGRHENFSSQEKFKPTINTKCNALTFYTSNYDSLFTFDRTTEIIKCHSVSVENADKEILRKALNTCSIKVLTLLTLLTLNPNLLLKENYFINNNLENRDKTKQMVKTDLKSVNGIDLLVNAMEELNKEIIDYRNISPKKICSLLKWEESKGIILSRVLRNINVAFKGKYVSKVAKSQPLYERWDLTKIKDLNSDIFLEEVDEDEVEENQKEWDRIIEILERELPEDDPNSTKEEDIFEDVEEDLDELFACFDEENDENNLYKNDKTFDKIDEANIWQKSGIDKKPVNRVEDQPTEDTPYERLNPANKEKYIFPCDLLSDKGVKSMRNFIFECDETPIREQVEMAKENKDVVNRAVFSGSKSIHCRITIDKEPKDKDAYKFIWNYLNNKYFDGKADKACSNPSRLTRTPEAIRPDNKKEQRLLYKKEIVISLPEEVEKDYNDFLKSKEMAKEMVSDVKSHKRESDNIIEELENFEDRTSNHEAWKLAYSLATNDGSLAYEDAAKAVSYIGCLGFTAEEIKEQIYFGNWNFTTKYIEELINN